LKGKIVVAYLNKNSPEKPSLLSAVMRSLSVWQVCKKFPVKPTAMLFQVQEQT
jgi:hypothetical protein